jgi:hypothetical protein
MSGDNAGHQCDRWPTSYPGYTRTSGTLARPIQAVAKSSCPSNPGIRRLWSPASNTRLYYRPQIHLGWIYPVITHFERRCAW